MTKYLLMTIALVLLLTILANVAYAMWSDKLRANVRVSLGSLDLKVTSHKFLCECCDHDSSYINVSNDGRSVEVYINNAEPNSSVWIGLVLSNEGTLPLKLTHIDVSNCKYPEIYVYGPFRAPGTSGVWGRVRICDLPFSGDTGLPSLSCDLSMKLIVWIKMLTPEAQGAESECTIALRSSLSI